MRFDGHRYRDCRWCGGQGCLQCENEANKAYNRQFPNGPEPMATFNLNDKAEAERCRTVFGAEALKKAFGPDGGGVAEIEENLRATDPSNTNT